MSEKKLLIITGENSGDLHGARLAENIFKIDKNIKISGIGGSKMKACGVDVFFDIKDLAVMGITEVFSKYGIIKDLLKDIKDRLINNPPSAVILIDYPGFNFKVAKIAHNLSIPVVYYICPQIWAWAPWRINKFKKLVDQAIVIFEFEKKLYQEAGVNVECIGHPILDTLKIETDKQTALKYFNMEHSKRIITIMPGSRMGEIKHHMPVLLETAQLIYKRLPHTKFIIPCADEIDIEVLGGYIKKTELPIKVIKGKNYDVINVADFVIVASGTATLEVACLGKPMVIIYRTSFINWFLAKIFMIVPFFGLVNILSEKMIVPEYLQHEVDPEVISEYIFSVLTDKDKYSYIQEELKKVREKLGDPGGSKRAANIILNRI